MHHASIDLSHVKARLADPGEKLQYNKRLFSIVAPAYNLISAILSFGRDFEWKKSLLQQLPARPISRIIDIACGPGNLTFPLKKKYPSADVYGVDLSLPMMRRKSNGLRQEDRPLFVNADMCRLPLPNGCADIVTGGYALRNAPRVDDAVTEICRVLRPGGAAAFLDFSHADNRVIFSLHYALLQIWGGLWGLVVHGRPAVYAYIADSLFDFPSRSALHSLFEKAGLPLTFSKRYMFGMIELFVVEKALVLPGAVEKVAEPESRT